MNRLLMALAFAVAAWSDASFGAQGEDAVRLQIAVMPELARHLEFPAAPGYIALALENNGLYLSLSSRLVTESTSKGTLIVRAYPPLKNLLPNGLTQRAEIKIAILNAAAQQKLLAYLDRLRNEQRARGRGFDGVLEAIVLQACDNSGGPGPGRDRGDAEPLSDQVLLLATVATWLIGFAAFLLFLRGRRKRARAPSA